MKRFTAVLVAFVFGTASAQTTTENSITGVWKGVSLCQVPNSPCHDETVVYYISKVQGLDTFSIAANKIVAGKEEEMGPIGCKWEEKNKRLVSTAYNGQWTFNFRGNKLDGTLYYQGKLYRVINLTKQK